MILQRKALACSLAGLPQTRQKIVGDSKRTQLVESPTHPEGLGRGSGLQGSWRTGNNPCTSRLYAANSRSFALSSRTANAATGLVHRCQERSIFDGINDNCPVRRRCGRYNGQSTLIRCNPDSGNSFIYSNEATAAPSTSNGSGSAESNGFRGMRIGGDLEGSERPANDIQDGRSGKSEDTEGEGVVAESGKAEEESPVFVFREVLRLAAEGLERARKRSEELEEQAQQVAEKAIFLKDDAAEAEAEAAEAWAKVEETVAQEIAAQEGLSKAEGAYALADAASLEAEAEFGAALRSIDAARWGSGEQVLTQDRALADGDTVGELKIGPRFEKEERERETEFKKQAGVGKGASVVAWRQAFEQAQADLNIREQELIWAKGEVQKLAALKMEYQMAAAELRETAAAKRAKAIAAEEEVARAMELAERAVGREVEASQRVSDAELALQKAEKLAAEVEQAAAAAAAAEKVERLALEAAEAAAALAASEEPEEMTDRGLQLKFVVTPVEDADEEPVEAAEAEVEGTQTGAAVEASDEAAVTVDVVSADLVSEAGVGSEPAGVEQETLMEGVEREKEGDAGEEREQAGAEVVLKTETESAKKTEAAKEPPLGAPPSLKPSPKKSSRFFPASYFSSADDAELSLADVVSGLFEGIKRQLPKVILAVALVFASGAIINARMEKKLLLQPPPEAAAGATMPEVAPTVKPLIAELQKLPSKVKAAIDMLPRNEPNEEETQLFDVLWLLLASVVFVPIFQKLPGGSPVLGYLAAGALIGPYALSIIQHVHGTKALAEFGVVFLMFNIGLELSLERLRSMKKYVFGLGTAQVLVTALAVGLFVSAVTGASGNAAIVIGNGLALSSTAVVLQVLQERGESTSRHGRATFSVLLFQDLAVVVLLILIPLLSPESAKGGGGVLAIIEALGLAALKAVVAITGIIAGGRLLLRPIYKRMAENHNAEIFAANTLLVVLGTSVLTARAGLSMALGAFLAGVLLAETEYALQVESDINPYRGLLLGLFFMTVGMSIDPKLLVAQFPLIVGAIATLIVGKTALIWGLGTAFGMSTISSIRAGLLLAPGGEFAFVAFGEAVQKGIMTQQMSSMLFLITGISMALTPYLAAGGQLLASKFEQQDVRSLQPDETETDDLQGHIIICGFGRVGQIIAQLLSERLIPFVALDVRIERVSAGRVLDLPVYFGDAGSREVLHKVGAERAAAAVITLDTPGANYRTVWALTKNFPNVKTFVRAHDIDHGINLEKAGATAVVPETLEPSLQLAAAVLAQVKTPAADIAAAIDEFRMRHLSELTELSTISKTSLGYGFSKLLTPKSKPPSEGAGSPTSKPKSPDDGSIDVPAASAPA